MLAHCSLCTADSATLFDVSHMGQIYWRGKDATKFLEHMVVGDVAGLGVGEGRLSLIMNEAGGIVDDTVITKYEVSDRQIYSCSGTDQ